MNEMTVEINFTADELKSMLRNAKLGGVNIVKISVNLPVNATVKEVIKL